MRRISALSRADDEILDAQIDEADVSGDLTALTRLLSVRSGATLPHIEDWGREYFPSYFTRPPSLMHLEMIEILHECVRERTTGTKEAMIAPRKGAKTTWCSKVFPLYCLCHDIEKYMLLIGDTSSQSQENLEAMKHELTTNEKLMAAYPHATGEGSVWNVDQIVTRNEIKVRALGAGMKFRGRTFRNYRAGLIVIDDLDNDEDVLSEDLRAKMWKWLTRVLIPMGTDATNILFIGTALHEDDTIHRVQKTGEWEFRKFRALISEPTNTALWDEWRALFLDFEEPNAKRRQARAYQFYCEHRDEMDIGAKLLWPEFEPLYSLMCYRTAYGEAGFLSEKQGDPSADGATEWPAELFAGDLYFQKWPKCIHRVMALDPSKGKTDQSDFSAYVELGLAEDGFLYIDADIKRRDATRIVEDGCDRAAIFRPDLFIVEYNQFQELLGIEFERMAAERGTILPLHGITNVTKKETRIRRLGPWFRLRKVRFKADSPGVETLLSQLRQFPRAKHDDGPDALDMAVEGIKYLQGIGYVSPDDELVSGYVMA